MNLEGIGSGLTEILWRNLPGGREKTSQGIFCQNSRFPAEIRIVDPRVRVQNTAATQMLTVSGFLLQNLK
jgi:hypothetical protein